MANKITAAFAAATQETTLALANLSFDLALIKVEAPKEYSGVGQHLSKKRRDAAENGDEHVIARRLGALFRQALPLTPALITAYGSRCSEISKHSAAAQKNIRSKTLFDDWVGADGTSIWAAATSGNDAIAVHLLACMLARVWSAAEATAIWEEIVEHRKAELAATDSFDPLGFSSLATSRIEVSRDQLSRWDASARAWISVADGVKTKEQKQLMLLMSDLSLPISGAGGVYGSVMSAWKNAMETMERLLNQVSQSIQDGAGLVGLASWHLYPDIYALEAVDKVVKFQDPLVPPKVLVTLGAGCSSSCDDSSAHWSLPLAHLRYYGDPVPTATTLAITATRLSMLECFHVILGAVFSTWGTAADDLDGACAFIITLSNYVSSRECPPSIYSGMNWLERLSETAQTFLKSQGQEKHYYRGLIARGQRRHGEFLAPIVNHPGEMFGLGSVNHWLSMIIDTDHKIAARRFIAENSTESTGPYMIRYLRPEATGSKKLESSKEKTSKKDQWEYATAVKPNRSPNELEPDSQTSSDREEWKSLDSAVIQEIDSYYFGWSGHIPESHMVAGSSAHDTTYARFFGELNGAALHQGDGNPSKIQNAQDARAIDLFLHALKNSWIDYKLLVKSLNRLGGPAYTRSLAALAEVANVYQQLPGATINPKVFTYPLAESGWVKDLTPPSELLRVTAQDDALGILRLEVVGGEIWACIAHFENPEIAWKAEGLTNVMALSCRNSIYVSGALVCDPFEISEHDRIKHIIGNIGRPGLSLMIPTGAPRTRKEDEAVWTHIDHNDFDGRSEDCFQHTSLHLKFTGYRMPYGGATHGQVTNDAFFVESVVSILDRSTWVADLDILKAVKSPLIQRIAGRDCSHQDHSLKNVRLTSIDSWQEYLDPPRQPGIFRSHRNWLARLAVVAHHAYYYREVVLLENSDAFCGACVSKIVQHSDFPRLPGAGRHDSWQLFVC